MGLGLHARCAAGRVRSLRPVLFLLWTQSSRARSPSPGASRPQRVSERGRPQDPAHPCWPLALRQSRESGACGGSRSPGLCAWAWLQGSQDTRATRPGVHGAGRVSCRAQLSGRPCLVGALALSLRESPGGLRRPGFVTLFLRVCFCPRLSSFRARSLLSPFRAAVCVSPSATATCSLPLAHGWASEPGSLRPGLAAAGRQPQLGAAAFSGAPR